MSARVLIGLTSVVCVAAAFWIWRNQSQSKHTSSCRKAASVEPNEAENQIVLRPGVNFGNIEEAMARRTAFTEFLKQEHIPYQLGIFRDGHRTDSPNMLRIEVFVGDGSISALFSPNVITCCVETQGPTLHPNDDGIYRWNSLEEVCEYVLQVRNQYLQRQTQVGQL